MDEISTRRPQRIFDMVEEIIHRRQEIVRIILMVLILALAMGFITNICTSWIGGAPLSNAPKIALIISGSILFISAYWALRSYAGKINKRMHFEILLPLQRKPGMKVPQGLYYKPLKEKTLDYWINQFLKKEREEKKEILEYWQKIAEKEKQTIEDKERPSAFLLFIIELVEFFIFKTLDDLADDSLTPKARFMPSGWVRPNYKAISMTINKELKAMMENCIYRELPDQVPKSIKFLEGFNFQRKAMTRQKKDDALYFEFIKRGYGSLKVTISPFPIIMPTNSRDACIMARYCGLLSDDLVVIKIPFMLTVDFGGFLMIRKQFGRTFAPWIEDLVDAINDNLDWQHCAQYDMERMMVELIGREI